MAQAHRDCDDETERALEPHLLIRPFVEVGLEAVALELADYGCG